MNPANIPKDKLLHFFWGVILSHIGLLAAALAWSEIGYIGISFPLLVAAAAGAHKEWKDSRGAGKVELLDFIYTTAGGIPVTLGMVACIMTKVAL
jgi:hypothetical protein